MSERSAETLRECVSYDPQSGELTWKQRPRGHFSTDALWRAWNTRFAGKPALTTKRPDGYFAGRVMWRMTMAHRLAWLIMTGDWPEHEIDHINGVRDDNRWCNLRSVTRVENARNLKRRRNNKSGATGVYFFSRLGRWAAKIRTGERYRSLGTYATKEEAIRARKAAEREIGFHPNHDRVA